MKIVWNTDKVRENNKSSMDRMIHRQKQAIEMRGIQITTELSKADAVHINSLSLSSCLLASKARRWGIPVIYQAHTFVKEGVPMQRQYLRWLRKCCQDSNVVIASSQYAKDLLLSYGVQQDIVLIANGVDTGSYTHSDQGAAAFRTQYGYRSTDKIVMSAGACTDKEGLLQFAALAERMPEYKFIWFGDYSAHFVKKSVRRALNSNLHNLRFAGTVDEEMIKKAYSGCDLYLALSGEEAEAMAVLEALSMEIPVLTGYQPIYEEWLQNGEHVYKAEDLMKFELGIHDILEQCVPDVTAAGRAVAEEHEMTIASRQLADLYRSLRVQERNALIYRTDPIS